MIVGLEGRNTAPGTRVKANSFLGDAESTGTLPMVTPFIYTLPGVFTEGDVPPKGFNLVTREGNGFRGWFGRGKKPKGFFEDFCLATHDTRPLRQVASVHRSESA